MFILNLNSSLAAGATNLNSISQTLKNVELAIYAAVNRSEEIFQQNGGATLGAEFDLIEPETSLNPFLNILRIEDSYTISIEFRGERIIDTSEGVLFEDDSESGENTTMPITAALNGAQIQLIPVYLPGDSVITTWECITNADESASPFMGANTIATVGNISFISAGGNNGSNVYLSNCIYINGVRF